MYIVLTDNYYFYNGVKSLLPNDLCRHQIFKGGLIKTDCFVHDVRLVIDCDIFNYGEWDAYDALHEKHPKINRYWVKKRSTGDLFPEDCTGDVCIKHFSTLKETWYSLKWRGQIKGERIIINKIKDISLSPKEKRLLIYLLAGYDIAFLSRVFNCSEKTLYTHQKNVLLKTGFKNISTLCQHVFINDKILWDISCHVY